MIYTFALQVMIMKLLDHPNIVNLIEVIDDPKTDHFYMGIISFSFSQNILLYLHCFNMLVLILSVSSVLEYVEGKWVCEGSDPTGGIGESTARKYLRDIVSGLMYLHAHV